MSADNPKRSTENLFFEFTDTENQVILFEEISRELEAFLARESTTKTRQTAFSTSCRQFPTRSKKNLTS